MARTSYNTAVSGNVPANWSAVGQRDFNGDGFGDILWRDTAGDVGIWLMNGTQIISSTVVGNVPINWSVAAPATSMATAKPTLFGETRQVTSAYGS